jgi:outer membrane protein assembly factor BamB
MPRHKYTLKRRFEVAGRQGVATDGEEIWVSGSTALYRYSREGALLGSNEAALGGLPTPANHLGDIDIFEGLVYAGAETFIDGAGQDIQILTYDAASLAWRASFPFFEGSGQREVSGIAVDRAGRSVWMSSWVGGESGRYLYQYDLDTGAYLRKVHLQPVPQWIQGIFVHDGAIYLTADDGNADDGEPDHLYRVDVWPGVTSASVVLEHTFADVERLGEIEGLAFDAVNRELLVHHNRGRQIVLGMPRGFYPGYGREIHEVYVYDVAPRR